MQRNFITQLKHFAATLCNNTLQQHFATNLYNKIAQTFAATLDSHTMQMQHHFITQWSSTL
jgi:hypothetical protein